MPRASQLHNLEAQHYSYLRNDELFGISHTIIWQYFISSLLGVNARRPNRTCGDCTMVCGDCTLVCGCCTLVCGIMLGVRRP